ncbi:unnamed protein product [Gordionus sp. m RMFG-2023]
MNIIATLFIFILSLNFSDCQGQIRKMLFTLSNPEEVVSWKVPRDNTNILNRKKRGIESSKTDENSMSYTKWMFDSLIY